MARDKSVFDSDLDFEPAVSQEATALEGVFVNQRHPKEPVFTLRAELAMIEAGIEHLPSAGRDDRHNPGGPPDEQWTAISTASHDLRRAGRVLHAGSLLPKNVTCHVSRSMPLRVAQKIEAQGR